MNFFALFEMLVGIISLLSLPSLHPDLISVKELESELFLA